MIRQFRHWLTLLLPAVLSLWAVAAESPPPDGSGTPPLPTLDCVIEPSETVDVGSAVPGVVEMVRVHRSDPVKKGAVLARLESSVDKAALELARARAAQKTPLEMRERAAKLGTVTEERNRSLLKKAVISKQAMDEVATEAEIARLQVEQEKENRRIARLEARRLSAVLEQRTIRSPVDGVVMERFKAVGEYVEDDPLVRVAQIDPLNVEVIVPVDYLGRIEKGMQARVTASLPGSDSHMATVQRVDRVADAASGTFGVQLNLANPDQSIPAGLRCQVAFLGMPAQPVAAEPEPRAPPPAVRAPQAAKPAAPPRQSQKVVPAAKAPSPPPARNAEAPKQVAAVKPASRPTPRPKARVRARSRSAPSPTESFRIVASGSPATCCFSMVPVRDEGLANLLLADLQAGFAVAAARSAPGRPATGSFLAYTVHTAQSAGHRKVR